MYPIWNFFLHRRHFSFLLFGVLALWGLFLAFAINKESAPEVQIPVGIVVTIFPGAGAEEVEKLITNKIEQQIANLTDLSKLTSNSSEGISTVVAEYSANSDIDESIRRLREEVEKVKPDLPIDGNEPTVSELNFVDQPVLIIAISTDAPLQDFAELGESLKRELQGVGGVSRVEVLGVRGREVQVVVRKEDLARHQISFNDIISAIRSANASTPAGSIITNNIEYGLRFVGDITDSAEIAGISLRTPVGSTIYLRDIAVVSDGVEKATSLTRLSSAGAPSEQALTVNVYKSRGADVTRVAKDIRSKLTDLQNSLLKDSSVVIALDSGELVQDDLGSLTRSGLITVSLVILCLILTIGWREAIIAGLAVPLSFLIAFIGLYYSGNTINFVSLFSLILAVGILVDAGIVVTEAMVVCLRRRGMTQMAAAQSTLREFAWPLIAGTTTTVAVFIPLFFISGVVGQFISSIPFTIIFVLIAAQIVALAILPLLVITFSQSGAPGSGRLGEIQAKSVQWARDWYRSRLERALSSPRFGKRFLIGIVLAFIIALTLPVVGIVKVEFFPAEDSDFVFINLELPEGTILFESDLAMRSLEEELYGERDIENFITTIGGTSAFSGSPENGERFGNILLLLPKDRKRTSGELVAELRQKFASFDKGIVRISEPQGGPPVGAPILIKFFGDDLGELSEIAVRAKGILQNIPGTIDVEAGGENDGLEFVLTADHAKFAELGLTSAYVAGTLRTAVYGSEATSIRTLNDDIRVVVRGNLNTATANSDLANHATIDAVRQIPLSTSRGEVLLGSVLNVTIEKATQSIAHEDRRRVISLTSQVLQDVNVRDVTNLFVARSESELELPSGVTMNVGGENEEVNESFKEMFYALIAGIFLMFGVVVLAFNSLRLGWYTLLTVPLTMIGVIGGLFLTQKPVSFPSLLGVIALAGVVINNAIILVDSFLHRLRENPDGNYKETLIETAVSRLRPIFLTTITTVVGMIPLIFTAAIWAPLAYTIMFGLLFATVLTLLMIPILLLRAEKKVKKLLIVDKES